MKRFLKPIPIFILMLFGISRKTAAVAIAFPNAVILLGLDFFLLYAIGFLTHPRLSKKSSMSKKSWVIRFPKDLLLNFMSNTTFCFKGETLFTVRKCFNHLTIK